MHNLLPRLVVASVALSSALAVACRPGPPGTPAGLTLAAGAQPEPVVTLVWVGRGVSERHEDGAWRRAPMHDYDFTVVQRRYANHWDSTKTMRRVHPAYDGSAGPRLQVYQFRLELRPSPDGEVAYHVASTLGAGSGHSDREFRSAVIELDADVSTFAPFDRYRITQRYDYEGGRLTELVELSDGADPWVRNREEAWLFGPEQFAGPPTTLTAAAPVR